MRGRRFHNLSWRGKLWVRLRENRDAIIALGALFAALVSAFVAAYSAVIQRRAADDQRLHNVLSVTPYITLKRTGRFEVLRGAGSASVFFFGNVSIVNEGLGPAIITRVRHFVDDVEYDGSVTDPEAYNEFMFALEKTGWSTLDRSPRITREVLRPTADRPYAKFFRGVEEPGPFSPGENAVQKYFENERFAIEYRSLYDECFEFDSHREPQNHRIECTPRAPRVN